MLKEKIFYKVGLPVNCSVVDIADYPIHFHDDMEVAFVLDGTVTLKNGYYTYTMNPGDIFILNDREIHSYYNTGESNMVMLMQLDLDYFCKYYDILINSFFVTDVKDTDDESLDDLRRILALIMLEFLSNEPGYERRIIENTHNLIDCLITNFQYFSMEDGRFINETKNKGNKILAGRMSRITDYMYENYNRRLTLNEIAKREHLSIYYLSHVIKAATGLSFQELLSFIRVEESEKLLLGTDKKIGAISVESGFSAVRYYIKYFTKWFGIHPAEYREKYTGHVKSRETSACIKSVSAEQIEKMIRKHAKKAYEDSHSKKETIITVELDIKEKNKPPTHYPDPDLLEPVSPMFCLLQELGEELVEVGSNYLVTSSNYISKKGSRSEGYSILFYNVDDKLFNKVDQDIFPVEMEDRVEHYTERVEILVKLLGLSGKFRIARCYLSRENILARSKASGNEGNYGKRSEVVKQWEESPSLSVESQFVTDSLNVQSSLFGFSAELVLIDPV
ncbi:MAG: AraC family transcriptional regulator [Eubacteriales bacterium]|nr:AraC family transcriptional regulator [Eubacteriales bacterium]MDD4582808.1 AraC family transcriptional regulator [Eubacteriales bacterium]